MKKTFYVTTPIYYPSAKLHIGHAYTTIAGDVISRYKRLKGYETFYLTGTDEHGQKLESAAKDRGKEPKDYIDPIVDDIKKVWASLDIKYDKFIRTTDEDHKQAVQNIFSKLLEKGDIYLGKYTGLYCKSDEAYYTQTQASNNICPDCGKELVEIEEESYFFKCSKYVDRLLEYYKSNEDFLAPKSRVNELINNFIKPGLEDLAVSRVSFKWGIEVRENPDHIIYVWMDALSNYITALGYNSDNNENMKFWPADVQLLGKEIVRFHAIYWPMFLMALDIELPKRLFAHGWLLMENDKMSKSKGNVIYPDFLIDNYGADTVRYYLLREVPFGSDGQFTPKSYISRINSDLVNDLSNLTNRTIVMVNKYFDGKVIYNDYTNETYDQYEKEFKEDIAKFEQHMEDINFSKALEVVWRTVSYTNKIIDVEEPWILGKDVEANMERLNKILWFLINYLEKVAHILYPFIPSTSRGILENINQPLKDTVENYLEIYSKEYIVSKEPKILYQRLNIDEEVKKIAEQMERDLEKAQNS